MSYSASSVSYSDSQEPAATPSATTGSGNGCCSRASAELKLYQAFIFSIPIFFTFILLFLFYLLYLRRRRVDWSSIRMRNNTPPSFHSSESDDSSRAELGLKKEVREMLPIIVFKESFSVKDTLCSVCLGDYQAEEKLQQIPACGHTFHMDCIDNWLATHATCPLCRQTVLVSTKALSEAPDVQSESNDRYSNPQNGEETSPENGFEHCEDNHQHDGEMCPENCNPQNGEEISHCEDNHQHDGEMCPENCNPLNGEETAPENGSKHCEDNHQHDGEMCPENRNPQHGEETSPGNGSEHCGDNHQHDGEMSPENVDERIPTTHEEGQTDSQNVEMVRND